MTDIEKLKALADAAPTGPWEYENDSLYFKDNGYTRHLLDADSGSDVEDDAYYAALKFIAAANPAAVLKLIAELESSSHGQDLLRGELELARDDLLIFKSALNSLGEITKKLVVCARTTGGTAGPDQGLMAACEAAEKVITLGGVARAMTEAEEIKAENTDLHATLQAAKGEIERLKAENEALLDNPGDAL